MFTDEDQTRLMHFGIKGMKWGVRKDEKKESVKNLSDDQLKHRLQRLNMETQYLKLTAPEKTRGQKLAKSVLSYSGAKLSKAVNPYVEKAVSAAVAKVVTNLTKP